MDCWAFRFHPAEPDKGVLPSGGVPPIVEIRPLTAVVQLSTEVFNFVLESIRGLPCTLLSSKPIDVPWVICPRMLGCSGVPRIPVPPSDSLDLDGAEE